MKAVIPAEAGIQSISHRLRIDFHTNSLKVIALRTNSWLYPEFLVYNCRLGPPGSAQSRQTFIQPCDIKERRMTKETGSGTKRKGRWRRPEKYICSTCAREQPFCWTCTCDFMICSDCMEENFWGMTCNGIHWTCPDCGAIRSFGND